jgi:hypothetical protein
MKHPLWERLPNELRSRVDELLANDHKLPAIKAILDALDQEGFERLLAETACQLAHLVCSRHGNIAAWPTRTAPVSDLKTR